MVQNLEKLRINNFVVFVFYLQIWENGIIKESYDDYACPKPFISDLPEIEIILSSHDVPEMYDRFELLYQGVFA